MVLVVRKQGIVWLEGGPWFIWRRKWQPTPVFLPERILWTQEPGGLLSIRLHKVGHYWSNLACMHALEKDMATHSSILAWRIPGTEEPGGLPSVGSHRLRHDWRDVAAAAAVWFIRKMILILIFPKRIVMESAVHGHFWSLVPSHLTFLIILQWWSSLLYQWEWLC